MTGIFIEYGLLISNEVNIRRTGGSFLRYLAR